MGVIRSGRWSLAVATVCLALALPAAACAEGPQAAPHEHLQRAKVFLAAGDYRRAIEACQREVETSPSAASYVYLTYVYQALSGYLEALAKEDRWVAVEHLYLSLAARQVEDLVDPPDVLARIAKEIIHESAQRQSDVAAAMAARLDKAETERLWQQQTAWRKTHPGSWWSGVPEAWRW